ICFLLKASAKKACRISSAHFLISASRFVRNNTGMRHHSAKRTLHRTKRQYTALLRSLARSLVLQEGITTTVAKAKELRPFVEKLVSESKKGTVQSQRLVVERIGSKEAAK